MVAIDMSASEPAQAAYNKPLVLAIVAGAVLFAVGSLVFDAGGEGVWRGASETISRFSLIVFAAAMMVEPLSRLIPGKRMESIGRERPSLMLAFVATSALSIFCTLARFAFGGERMSVAAVAFCCLTGAILFVMLVSGNPATKRLLGAPASRALQGIATAYFWIAFLLIGTSHLAGPNRPSGWYGFSLLVLVLALLVRFADAFAGRYRRPRLAEKVV
jgi:hypothetical protein